MIVGEAGSRLATAGEIAQVIRAAHATASEVMDQHLTAIANLNPRLNALVAEHSQAARVAAAHVDRSPDLSSLGVAGLPFTVKDVIATSDLPTTCGSRVMADYQPSVDATAVSRLRRAGAILVGKTNCPEFAFAIDTTNALFGRTYNPLGEFTAGGSSGGEAAAIASGMSSFGLGSDFGGSVRWPAQCTGIVGLRPTIGRVPATGLLPTLVDDQLGINQCTLQGHAQTIGPMARCVDDVEMVLRVIAGPDGIDPFAEAVPLRRSREVDLRTVTVAYGFGFAEMRVEDAVADAVEFAASALRDRGLAVNDRLPGELGAAVEVYGRLRAADPLTEIARVSADRIDDLTPYTQRLLLTRAPASHSDLTALWRTRAQLRRQVINFLSGDRVMLMPIAQKLPLPLDEVLGSDAATQFDLMACSRAVALLGLPALSVPCRPAPDGRPVSVQVVGPPFREDLVLAVGRAIEQFTRSI